jgi:L-ascorbate metabolism protein UlaG (beta-lactamase superfamily)
MEFQMRIKKILTIALVSVGALVVLAGLALQAATFGGTSSGARLLRMQASAQFKDGAFFNLERQAAWDLGLDYLLEQFFGDQVRTPPLSVPILEIEPESLSARPTPGLRVAWLGHASVLLELDGQRLLVDPVLSEFASPFQFVGPRRMHPPPIALQDLDHIDAVMISHDHYDHLDMATVSHLAPQGTQFFVPLGVGAHLEKWGVAPAQITELEWWESAKLGDLNITSTPNRHYSGRSLFDYKATLWSSWSIVGPKNRAFYSGDTGYSEEFSTIGKRFGPFDLSVIKIGAYGPGNSWSDIHMTPEQALQVHLDVGAKRMLPVHWATFNLALHAWDEPIKRLVAAATEQQVDLVTPRIGELVNAHRTVMFSPWWEAVK